MVGIYILVGIGIVAVGVVAVVDYLDSILNEDIR